MSDRDAGGAAPLRVNARASVAAGPTLRRRTCRVVVVALALTAGRIYADDTRAAFRPCIDPANLPFANDKGEGFENRIADLFAKKLALPVQSYASPQRMNFIRNTLRYKLPGEDFRCDVVMGVPVGYRPGCGDGPVLPFDLRARLSQGKGPRPGQDRHRPVRACRPTAEAS